MTGVEGVPAFLKPNEVAKMLSVSLRCVTGWAATGVIPGAHRLGGVWRFDAVKFERWLSETERMPAPSTRSPAHRIATYVLPDPGTDDRLERLLGLVKDGKRVRPASEPVRRMR